MEETTTQSRSSNSMVIIFIVIALVVVGGYLLMRGMNQGNTVTPTTTDVTTPNGTEPSMVQSFSVEGSEFAFSPATMTVPVGSTVTVTFTNTGKMPHDFVIDEIDNARTQVLQPGQSETIEFTPSQAGTFEYYCSVGNHRAQGMVGTLTVQ